MTRRKLRPVSKKTAAVIRELTPERREYRNKNLCCICGNVPEGIHEIIGGRFKQRTYKDIRFWLPACNIPCHGELQGMPKEQQWALKLVRDPEHFDVSALSELPGSVADLASVLRTVRELLLEGDTR